MSTRLSEIAQRLAAAKSAPLEPLPDITQNCWAVPGKFVAVGATLALAQMYRHAEEDLEYLLGAARSAESTIAAVVAGFTPDPGTSDLDDEQPIVVWMKLGQYRKAEGLLHELRKA